MNSKLIWKFVIILALAALCGITIWQQGLKPGIDLAGGTSLLYQIDTTDLTDRDKRELGQNMITILRKRIDPDGTASVRGRNAAVGFPCLWSSSPSSSPPRAITRGWPSRNIATNSRVCTVA